jgi:DNA repair protein RecO (recombination protein O)
VERFLTGKFFLYYNPVRKEYSLVDVEPLSVHETLVDDLRRIWAASFCCEMAVRTIGGDSMQMFLLLNESLDLLAQGAVVDRLLIQYVWKLLHIAGNAADLDSCPVCDRAYAPDEVLGFSVSLLAPCCRSCAGQGDEMALPPGARRYLSVTASMELAQAVELELSDAAQLRIKGYMLRYASLFAGGGLKTLAAGVL